MAIQDTPIEVNSFPLEDTPVPAIAKPQSRDTDSFETVQAALLDNYVTGNDVLDNYNYYSGVLDKKQELQKLSAQKAAIDSEEITNALVEDPYGPTGSIEDHAQAAYAATRVAIAQGKDVDRQFTESMIGDVVELKEVDKQTAKAKMFKLVSDMEEDIDGWDVAGDFLVSMLPFVESYRGSKLTGRYLKQEETIKQAISRFQNLPIEEQSAMFPYLKEHLVDTVGDVHAVRILSNFLKPMGAENSQGFSDAEKVFDVIDAAGFTVPIAWALKSMKSGYNVVKASKALKNERLAIDSNLAAMGDEDVAKSLGLAPDTATGNAMPFDTSIVDIGHTKDLSAKQLTELDEFFGQADKLAEDIIAGKSFLKEGVVNTRKRAELEAEAISRIKAEKAENIVITKQDEVSTTFSYQILDEEGNLTDKTYDMVLSLNDAGMYEQDSVGLISKFTTSPSVWAKGSFKEDVDTAQRIDYLNDRLNRQLLNTLRDAMKPIGLIPTPKNKAAHARVDNALIQGDEWKNLDGTRGKVFTTDELRTHFNLESNEISAYYRINRIYNNLQRIRNHEIRQAKILKGHKNVNFTRNGESMEAKPFDRATDANLSLRSHNTNFVYDADLDDMVMIKGKGDNFVENIYANDKKIVRLSEPYDIGGGRGKVNFAIVNNDDIVPLPQQVISRKKGYVPRIYENGSYFVKEVFEEVVDGDKTALSKKTLRFFSSKKEANEYVEQLVQKEIAKTSEDNAVKMAAYNKKKAAYEKGMERYKAGKRKTMPKEPVAPKVSISAAQAESKARAKYLALSDREEQTLSAATGGVGHGSGGLYTGARAQDDILFGLNGDKAVRLNSFESLTRNIHNLSRFTSINQWRMGMEQRWVNTANRLFEARGSSTRFTEMKRLSTEGESAEIVATLNKMYDQIMVWQNVPTLSEQAWRSGMQKLYDTAADRGMAKTSKLLGNLRDKNPIAVARAVSFHSLLGWFNMSQLWVQAQGAAVAASLGAGKYLTKSIEQTISLHMMDVGKDGIRGAAGTIGRAAGMTEKEVLHFHELWRKTGYFDSVKQTADHAAISKGYGMSADLFKRTMDTGLLPYRTGELINRRLSFSIATNRWIEKGAEKGIRRGIMDIDDVALKSIMDDANAMMLGMTKGNGAYWQRGVLSLPTQYLQVTTKFLETAGGFNGKFSLAERQRMIAAQLVLYGTAGVPMAGLGTSLAVEAFGLTQKDLDDNPGLVKTWNDGFWGAATFWILGADIETSSRGSLLRGISDFMDNWFLQESTMVEKFAGAFGSTQTRYWDSFMRYVTPLTTGSMDTIQWEDGAKLLTMPFVDMISSSRNIVKAEYMQRLDAIYSSTGRLHDTRDYSFMEEWAVRLGFQHTKDVETWDIQDRNKAAEELKKGITSYVLNEMNSFALKYPLGGYSDKEYADYNSRVQVALGVLDPNEAREVNLAIERAITSGSRRSQAIQKSRELIKTSLTGQMEAWRAALLGNSLLRVEEPTEEQE